MEPPAGNVSQIVKAKLLLLKSPFFDDCISGLNELKTILNQSENVTVFINEGGLGVLYGTLQSKHKNIVDYVLSCLGRVTASPHHIWQNVSIEISTT